MEGQEMEYLFLLNDINEFVKNSSLNKVSDIGIEKIFEQPLVGVASAEDPLFKRFKDPSIVGENHFLPSEWLPGAKSIISYFLPFSEEIRLANRKVGLPAQEWLYGRIEGQQFNGFLSERIVDLIKSSKKGNAVAPAIDPRFEVSDSMVSNWSERHVAYVAGLGTFSLSRSLITEKGCAGRFGSIVSTRDFTMTKRKYNTPFEYCSFCGECIQRCPVRAIAILSNEKKAGMDRTKCRNYVDTKIRPRFKPRYGCGKCQTAVQCEHRIPVEGSK
jgi:epoxyqueuosine reductase